VLHDLTGRHRSSTVFATRAGLSLIIRMRHGLKLRRARRLKPRCTTRVGSCYAVRRTAYACHRPEAHVKITLHGERDDDATC